MIVTVAFDLTMLVLVGLNVLGIVVYVAVMKLRARRLARAQRRIVEAVTAYFSRTGLAVRAEVLPVAGTEHFTVIADTEPLKRLRHSHIVEMVLIEEVKKATDLIVERVFWRFPLPAREGAALVGPHPSAEPTQTAVVMDPYLEQGLARLHTPDGLVVQEDSWAHFQEAMNGRQEAPAEEPPPH